MQFEFLQFYSFTVLENVFFKMPQRKVNVITERRIFACPRDILQLIEQTLSRLKFTLSGNGFLYLRQSVSKFFH